MKGRLSEGHSSYRHTLLPVGFPDARAGSWGSPRIEHELQSGGVTTRWSGGFGGALLRVPVRLSYKEERQLGPVSSGHFATV